MRTRSRDVKVAFSDAMPPDKSQLAARVKAARAWLSVRWADFRSRSRFFQAKTAIVAAYVVVVLLTALLAPPSPEEWVVRAGRIPFGIAFKTFVEIHNLNAGGQDGLVVEVTGSYTEFDNSVRRGTWAKKVGSIEEGQKLKLWPEDLKDLSGRSPANTLVVEHLRILDGEDEVLSLGPDAFAKDPR